MSFAAAFQNLRIPTIPITSLGCHSSVIFKGYCRSSHASSPDICVHEELSHSRTGISMGDAFQGLVESIEAPLVRDIRADG